MNIGFNEGVDVLFDVFSDFSYLFVFFLSSYFYALANTREKTDIRAKDINFPHTLMISPEILVSDSEYCWDCVCEATKSVQKFDFFILRFFSCFISFAFPHMEGSCKYIE